MAKIVAFGEFKTKAFQEAFENVLQKEIEGIEKKLDIPEGENLLVLTDTNTLTIGNYLLDARDNMINASNAIQHVLNILNIGETNSLEE